MKKKSIQITPILAIAVVALMLGTGVLAALAVTALRGDTPSAAERAYAAKWADVPAVVDRAAAERAMVDGHAWAYRDGCRLRLLVGGVIWRPDDRALTGPEGAIIEAGTMERLWGCFGDRPAASEPASEPAPRPVAYVAAAAQAALAAGNAYEWREVDEVGCARVMLAVPGAGTFALPNIWFATTTAPRIPAAGTVVWPNFPATSCK